ncbi:hypothetical protein [Moorena sp. SIO3I6]|uniref:beta-propeller domain-containing protein n=1 Tax=Moorena sp. SIO3I6 TaxID=2607831 RepID=UPI0013FA105A|nr:hypothetical protein [Moorena sp. SIO3I6]NEP22897.1 WD40 repeat domain-containing protein [Moorena sp. SIO3I6]
MSNLRSCLEKKSPEEIEHFLGDLPRLWLESDKLNELCLLLSNYEFIEAKITHPQFGVKALIEDYDLIDDIDVSHPDYSEQTITSLKLIQGALRLSTHILIQDPTQLAGQLSGRLVDFDTPDIQRLLQQIPQTNTTCLRSLRATLNPPNGPLLSTLSGHGDSVNAVAVTPDGTKVISGSSDHTVKVWDLNTGAEIRTLTGHTSPVNAVAVTPDGTRVISGASDNTVRVWNLATGKEILRFNGHSLPVVAVAVTPDGKEVVSASIANYDSIKVWDLETGQEELTLKGHRDIVRTVAITCDNRVISGSDDRTIKIWNLESGKMLYELIYKSYYSLYKVDAIAVNSDANILIAGCELITQNYNSRISTIIMWDLKTNKVIKEFEKKSENINWYYQHRNLIVSLAFTPDEKRIISASLDKNIKVWDTKSGQEFFTLNGHNESIYAITITPDGKTLISASKDKTLKVWNLESVEKYSKVIYDNKSVNDVIITPDSKQAIFSLTSNLVTVYNLAKIKPFFRLSTDKRKAQNKYFLDKINNIFIWTITINMMISAIIVIMILFLYVPLSIITINFHFLSFFVKPFKDYFKKSKYIKNLKYTNKSELESELESDIKSTPYLNNKKIIAIGFTQTKKLICVNKNNLLLYSYHFLTAWDLKRKTHSFDLRTTSQWLFSVLGFLIFIASLSFLVFSWERFFIYLLPLPWLCKILIYLVLSVILILVSCLVFVFYDSLTTISITPDGNHVISGSTNSNINVWHLQTQKLRFVLKGHHQEITSLAITPDGKYLVSGSKDKTIKIWNLETRKQCFTLIGHIDSVNTLAVTPDGKYVVSGSKDNTIKIWDLEKREEIFTFTGHTDTINRVKVTSNGKLVISASSDKTLQVWDFETREVIAKFTGESAINCCAVAPDDVTIVAGDEGGNMHFLRLEGVGSRE